jgi:hypothetical protein
MKAMRLNPAVSLFLLAGALAGNSGVLADTPKAQSWDVTLEQDWIISEKVGALGPSREPVTTAADAAGGCDGIKNGEWGFHTGLAKDPWWQVDLSTIQPLREVRVWNRGAAAERAFQLQLLVSDDGSHFQKVYQHDGAPFHGFSDGKPLVIKLDQVSARFVRISVPGTTFLHLDEVEVFGATVAGNNLALHQPADQASVSEWSVAHTARKEVDWAASARASLATCRQLRGELGLQTPTDSDLSRLEEQLDRPSNTTAARQLFLEARRLQRQLALQNPLLREMDTLLFTKKVPGSFNHMSDQYYGWWSKPGGGIFLLKGFTSGNPTEQCLTASFKESGSFLRPTLSYDGRKVLFAWCHYYPGLAANSNKLDKATVPEDAFYHLFEMNIDGTGVRQLTRGKYDDFDGRYLPDGRIVFLSTRRGQALQVGWESAARSVARPDMPDCYVRCGGGPERPVAVYTLHTMDANGGSLCAISPFEMFEWTPEIGRDGSIIYSRWDYIDRDNMPFMGLWAINPDGSNARLVYKNYTRAPHCTFEAKPIPGSHKIVFTASAHHAHTMGSLVLLDPSAGLEGASPISRLTPEVQFPEIEGWPLTSYANPWPLSERFYVVAWGCEGARVPGPEGWSRWHAVQRPNDGMALYFYDAGTRTRELLWADASISCGDPIPVRSREQPPVVASRLAATRLKEGNFILADVYQGLTNVERGQVKSLRLVAVPAKTHPTMNFPSLGVTADDPGKCVLGTVPVEEDGSAYFRAPAGVIVFFQALDAKGMALQTMRSVTHVQPGQTLGCIGCHESRHLAPTVGLARALARSPSPITPGPEGSWPLRFDRLVQPLVAAHCVNCHNPAATNAVAAKFDLSPARAYASLVAFGKPSLQDQVRESYRRGFSTAGEGIAQKSALLRLLDSPEGHYGVLLDHDARERVFTWMDTYAQVLGSFSEEQERDLIELKRSCVELLAPRSAGRQASAAAGFR